MLTFDGDYVGPETDNAPSLAAIAMSLGRQPRFAGQTRKPFNVLAHSFLVADLVEEPHKRHALLHDAAEAIVGDIPSSWKTKADREREKAIMGRIYWSLHQAPPTIESADAVKRADCLALRLEATLLMPGAIGHAPRYAVKPVTQFTPGFLHLPKAEYWIEEAQRLGEWIYPNGKWVRHFCELLLPTEFDDLPKASH